MVFLEGWEKAENLHVVSWFPLGWARTTPMFHLNGYCLETFQHENLEQMGLMDNINLEQNSTFWFRRLQEMTCWVSTLTCAEEEGFFMITSTNYALFSS